MGRWTIHGLLFVVAACGAGDDDELPEVPRPACPDHVNARFGIDDRGHGDRRLIGDYRDRPAGGVDVELADGCTSYSFILEDDTCTTSCDADEECVGNTCAPPTKLLDIGTVHVSGTDPELDLIPTLENRYIYVGVDDRPIYPPGADIMLSGGSGDSGVEPFAVSAAGVPDLTVPATTVSVAAGDDLVVRWDTADSAAGARIHFHAFNDGALPEYHVECWWADTGEMTVPAADLEKVLPPSGDSIDTVSLTRIAVGTTETEHGCAELETSSYVRLELAAE